MDCRSLRLRPERKQVRKEDRVRRGREKPRWWRRRRGRERGTGDGARVRVGRGGATIDVWSQDTDARVDKEHIRGPSTDGAQTHNFCSIFFHPLNPPSPMFTAWPPVCHDRNHTINIMAEGHTHDCWCHGHCTGTGSCLLQCVLSVFVSMQWNLYLRNLLNTTSNCFDSYYSQFSPLASLWTFIFVLPL